MRRTSGVVAGLIVALVVVLAVAGFTDAFGTGSQLRTNLGGTMADGAASDTFWDSNVIDIPGLSVTGVHCHGRVQYELQAGATGPIRDNACYAAMGSYRGETSDWGVYELLPGDRAVYRISENYGAWRYCVGGLITGPGPVDMPC